MSYSHRDVCMSFIRHINIHSFYRLFCLKRGVTVLCGANNRNSLLYFIFRLGFAPWGMNSTIWDLCRERFDVTGDQPMSTRRFLSGFFYIVSFFVSFLCFMSRPKGKSCRLNGLWADWLNAGTVISRWDLQGILLSGEQAQGFMSGSGSWSAGHESHYIKSV